MKTFHYRAYGVGGRVEDGQLEAGDREDAIRRLAQAGKKPFEIGEGRGWRRPFFRKGAMGLGARMDFGALFRDLDVLMSAGFDIDAALAATRHGRRLADVQSIDAAIQHLKSGGTLSRAFAEMPGCPEDILNLLESGENSGRVDKVVSAIAVDLARQKIRANALIEALIYPAFLVFMMLGAIGVITFYLVPALAPIFEGSPEKKPLILVILGEVGNFFEGNFILCLVIVLALPPLAVATARSSTGSRALTELIMRVPTLGTFIRDRAMSRYLGVASLLTGQGVPINKALELAVKSCPLKMLRPALTGVRTQVVEGGSLVGGLRSARLLDEATLAILSVGEDANRLPEMLERAGFLLERRTSQLIDRSLKILTPLITIVMGALIGVLVISVMTSILSINDLAFD